MGNKTSSLNTGTVVAVRGSVVDIRFDEHLPPIYQLKPETKSDRKPES